MTKDELKAIRERLNAATPGPWKADCKPGDCVVWGPEGLTRETSEAYRVAPVFLMNLAKGSDEPVAFDLREKANAEFIAHARTDVEELLNLVEMLMEKACG